ncbi:hypothetical protein H2198_009470 [Neophaeococcomyces mojaviensis]|uniref:Uncharacterized protein n=1 Tax=Neophaeococcomyces mojaviensis TaxID=3383035 RepID=A0ACC2ZUD9_9EURO|nr:hypothetical protein H2198_009470 [Knufia sp. JES_112]
MNYSLLHQVTDHPGGERDFDAFFLQARCSNAPKFRLTPETGRHIFKQPLWTGWMQSELQKLLVITGPLGSGKTSYCVSILKEFRIDASRVVLSYFFNAAQSATDNAVQSFLTGIISQLWTAGCETVRRQVRSTLYSYLRTYSTLLDCPNDVLAYLARRLVGWVKPFALLVDGIDQCGSEQHSVVAALDKIISGRCLLAIAACRGFGPFDNLGYATRFELLPAIVYEDLKLVVQDELLRKLKLRGHGNEELREEVGQFILKHAQVNFLHARLLVDIISTKTRQNQVREIMENFSFKQLQDLPAQYEDLNATMESSLPKDDLLLRSHLLQIVAAAREPWKLDDIDEILAIDIKTMARDDGELSSDIRQDVERLGQLFLQIGPGGEVTFYHTAARDFFLERCFTINDANLYLAQKCIAVLSQPYYRDVNRAADLLKKHIIQSTKYGSSSDEAFSESPIYEYAVKHFHEHLVRVIDPPEDLVAKFGRFLRGTEFVSWSEALFGLQRGNGFNGHNVVFKRLLPWVKGLSPENQREISINDYFELPHVLLADILKDGQQDAILQYLPRIRVGTFFNGAAQREEDWQKAVENKEIVVKGLSSILEPKDQFLLKARSALYQEYFWQKKFIEAREQLLELYKLQMEVVGESKEDVYETAWLLGYAYIALREFDEAGKLLQNAADRVQKLRGKEYLLFLFLCFLEGQRLDAIQELEKARAHYETVLETLVRLVGSENSFTLMVKTALGSLLRKQQCFKEAETLLFEGYAGRQLIFTIDINVNVDAAMQLALMYRDKGAGEKCIETLDSVAKSEVFQLDFERHCQQTHIRALVAFDDGKYDEPKGWLLALLEEASGEGRDKNNRELLWVRIDLADVMRRHDEADEALMLFADLVRGTKIGEEDLRDEPEPVSQLRIAEKALRFERRAKFAESRQLLNENNLEWIRDADFWILTQGGPIIDTAIIKS